MPVDTPEVLRDARSRIAEFAERRGRLVATPLDRAGRQSLAELDARLRDVITGLGALIDPCDASPAVPLVLLPVRVQTKLRPGTSTLRVRITPDEVHIDALVRSTTPKEAAAGRAYWTDRWADAADPGAWGRLVEAVGDRRAGWVAHATTPVNLIELGTGTAAFPESPEEITSGTVARCLPDQFVVRVFPSGAQPVTAIGAPIPRDIPISPLALGDDDVADVRDLRVPVGSEWTVDFERAKEIGLGVDVELPGGTTLLDRVVVVGTRNSASEDENAADLGQLLTSHRFSDGFSLLPAGTPTNNAVAERSPYRPDARVGAPPATPPAPSADATSMAALLGIDAAAVQALLDPGVPGSSLETAQRAANTALWFATFEPVLTRIEDADVPEVTPASIESARRVHRDAVRGAGHAPAMRVGAQPYGILPVTNLGSWTPRRGDITAAVEPLIERTLGRWVARSRTVPHVGIGDEVSDEALLEMLGTSPFSTSVRGRPALDGQKATPLGAAAGYGKDRIVEEIKLARAMLAQYSPNAAKWMQPPLLSPDTRALALPLVSERDAAVIAEILADGQPKVDSVLQALLEVAWDEAKRAVFRAAPKAHVPPLLELLEIEPEMAVLVQSVVDERPMVEPGQPERLFAAAERLRAKVHFEGQPTASLSLAAIEPVAEARTSLAQVALDLGVTPEARWIGSNAIAGILDAFAMRWEVEAAMTELGAAPLEDRRIAVASALDIASHRVDAWATGLAVSRQRSLPMETGMTLGAFGYVEGVRLGARSGSPEGWLHAPSTTHAVAAGVLASAHRSNIGAKAGRQPFAIDLSSRRGAELRRVLQGVHAGQSIGALLGYQIERGLSGSAARFQLSLRELAPLNTDELGNDLAPEERSARVAAIDVVDGVELLRQFPAANLDADPGSLRTKLATQPQNAYIEVWPAVTEEEWDTVKRSLRAAAETLDMVSDALLSESVLQYASGNAARASAAMDAMSSGAAVEPELGVLNVRQTGRTLTHALFAAIPAGATGWSTTRPRAIAEPRLEAWAARRLGDPADIVVSDTGGVRHTLDEAGFAALDLVFADDPTALERELRAAIPALGDAPLARLRGADWPAGSRPLETVATIAATLRTLAAGATPLGPDGLVRSGTPAQRTLDTDELLGRCEALLDALEQVLDDGQDVIAALEPPDDDPRPPSYAIAEDQVDTVRDAVRGLAAFGIPLVPDPRTPTNAGWAAGAWYAASARLDAGRALLADARAPHDPAYTAARLIDAATAIGEAVLGDGFRVLPLLRPGDPAVPDEFVSALRTPAFEQPPRSAVSGFVRDHATVRPGVARLAEAQLLGRAAGVPIELTAVQLTERDDDGPAPGTDRWLAGVLADNTAWPAHTATHVVVELLGGTSQFEGPFAGIAFDGWTETLPYQPDPRAVGDGADLADPLLNARATTGLAVHADQASARPPQVVLSAVSPDGNRWTTDSVVQAVLSAIDVAKARLVTLEHVPGDAAILPAIYVASPWLQPRKGFAFGELAAVSWDKVAYRYLSEVE
jgi:hypothetical protein